MNPQEKAKELVERFRMLARISGGSGTSFPASKQCALICVDEIFKELSKPMFEHKKVMLWRSEVDYWKQVKQEIYKL